MNVSGTGLSGSQTFTANQSTAATFTVTSNATNANTASTIVARDGSGNFSAGTITAALSGNASTATTAANVNNAAGYVYRSGVDTAPAVIMNSDGAFYGHVARRTTQQWGMGWGGGVGAATTFGIYYDTSGNFTATGNVTAFSDEKLKTNWRSVKTDFIELLAKVKYGIYDRIDCDLTQAGVSAQSWQNVLPETVEKDALTGTLSVAYGNAALVSAIKLAERVVELTDKLAVLEAKLEQLTKDKS